MNLMMKREFFFFCLCWQLSRDVQNCYEQLTNSCVNGLLWKSFFFSPLFGRQTPNTENWKSKLHEYILSSSTWIQLAWCRLLFFFYSLLCTVMCLSLIVFIFRLNNFNNHNWCLRLFREKFISKYNFHFVFFFFSS